MSKRALLIAAMLEIHRYAKTLRGEHRRNVLRTRDVLLELLHDGETLDDD